MDRGVRLHVEQPGHMDGADLAHRVEVVAQQVDDHQVLCAVLLPGGEVLAQCLVLLPGAAARPGALDGLGLHTAVGVDGQEPLRGGAEHRHAREFEQGSIGHGADPAQCGVERQRGGVRGYGDHVGQADLVRFAVLDLRQAFVDALEVRVLVVPDGRVAAESEAAEEQRGGVRLGAAGGEPVQPPSGVVQPGIGLPAVVARRQAEYVRPLLPVIQDDHPVHEHQGRVRVVGAVHGLAGRLGLQLVPQVADVAEVELEGQAVRYRDGTPAELFFQVGEEPAVDLGVRPVGAADGHGLVGDAVGEVLAQRAVRAAEEGESGEPVDDGAAVQPEGRAGAGEEGVVDPFGGGQFTDLADVHLVGVQLVASGRLRGGAARGGEGEVPEVGQDFPAALAADGLGVELHAPEGLFAVAQPHDDAVVGPGDRLQLRRQVGDGQGVVAHHGQRRRETLEQSGTGVPDLGQPSVHRARRQVHARAEELGDALVAEADAEDGQPALLDGAPADAEVAGAVRAAGTWRDDDGVEVVDADPRPLVVVADDDRRAAVHFADELEQVVGEGVVVVDQEGSHGDRHLLGEGYRGRRRGCVLHRRRVSLRYRRLAVRPLLCA